MNKEQLIQEFLKTPVKKDDFIMVKGLNSRDPNQLTYVTVTSVDEEYAYYIKDGYSRDVEKVLLTEVERDTSHIGANPFQPDLRGSRYNIDIWQLLFRCGWHDSGGKWMLRIQEVEGIQVPEVCHDPIVRSVDGKEVMYQRGLVWSLEQKQLLIDSIYNNVEIGKFVIRPKTWAWVQSRIKNGKVDKHTAFADIVDGKQRINTLIEFVTGNFPDSDGHYWDDLSVQAQRKFKGYMQFSYIELAENSTDADVLKVFLAINHTGIPMSREHIDFVKSIKV